MKIKVFVVVFSAAFIFLMTFLALNYNPRYVIKKSLDISLPNTCKVEKFSHKVISKFYYAKIKIPENDLETVKNEIAKSFEVYTDDLILNGSNRCKWWDLDEKQINTVYFKIISDKVLLMHRKSHPIYAFIDNYNYLYICY